MNPYISQLKTELSQYALKCGDGSEFTILELLWYCYSASNPVDDGQIRQAESALSPVFKALPFENSNALFDLVSKLCTAYQRAAFLEGIQIGAHLADELKKGSQSAAPLC